MKLVRQEHANGCTIACLAMVMGVTYQEALRFALPDGGDPKDASICHRNLHWWLADAGFAVAVKYKVQQPGNRERPIWPLAPWADLHHVNLMYSESSKLSHAVLMLGDGS